MGTLTVLYLSRWKVSTSVKRGSKGVSHLPEWKKRTYCGNRLPKKSVILAKVVEERAKLGCAVPYGACFDHGSNRQNKFPKDQPFPASSPVGKAKSHPLLDSHAPARKCLPTDPCSPAVTAGCGRPRADEGPSDRPVSSARAHAVGSTVAEAMGSPCHHRLETGAFADKLPRSPALATSVQQRDTRRPLSWGRGLATGKHVLLLDTAKSFIISFLLRQPPRKSTAHSRGGTERVWGEGQDHLVECGLCHSSRGLIVKLTSLNFTFIRAVGGRVLVFYSKRLGHLPQVTKSRERRSKDATLNLSGHLPVFFFSDAEDSLRQSGTERENCVEAPGKL